MVDITMVVSTHHCSWWMLFVTTSDWRPPWMCIPLIQPAKYSTNWRYPTSNCWYPFYNIYIVIIYICIFRDSDILCIYIYVIIYICIIFWLLGLCSTSLTGVFLCCLPGYDGSKCRTPVDCSPLWGENRKTPPLHHAAWTAGALSVSTAINGTWCKLYYK